MLYTVLTTAPAMAPVIPTDAVVLQGPADSLLRVTVDMASLRGPVDTTSLAGIALVTHTVAMYIPPLPMTSTVIAAPAVVDMTATVPSPAASCSKDVYVST
jgi:hypothetical protein